MISIRTGLTRLLPSVLALLIVCLAPAALLAESFQFRNDCRAPVVVYVTPNVKGVPKRDQYVLKPGDASPKLPFELEQTVAIYDPQTNKLLFKDVLKKSPFPLAFRIVPDGKAPGGIRLLLPNAK